MWSLRRTNKFKLRHVRGTFKVSWIRDWNPAHALLCKPCAIMQDYFCTEEGHSSPYAHLVRSLQTQRGNSFLIFMLVPYMNIRATWLQSSCKFVVQHRRKVSSGVWHIAGHHQIVSYSVKFRLNINCLLTL